MHAFIIWLPWFDQPLVTHYWIHNMSKVVIGKQILHNSGQTADVIHAIGGCIIMEIHNHN